MLAIASELDALDAPLIDALPLAGAGGMLDALRSRMPSAFEGMRVASWFRSSLRKRIAGGAESLGAVRDAVATYEDAQRPLEALRLALRADDAESAAAIVARHARAFLDAGTPHAVGAALGRLDAATDDPAVTAMRAIVEAQHGRSDTAEAYFRRALGVGGGDVANDDRPPLRARPHEAQPARSDPAARRAPGA